MDTFTTYGPEDYFDELIDKIKTLPQGDLLMRQQASEALLLKMGITFNAYGRDEGVEKIFPFDTIPRIVASED